MSPTTRNELLTFHGSQELKDQRIAQVRAHRLADQLVKGRYWQDGKGCAVGCTIHSADHHAYEIELGIPVELAYLEDRIFESLDNGQAMMWPERFLQAIPVGVDLRRSHINKRFVLALITDEQRGILTRLKNPEAKAEMQKIAEILSRSCAAATPEEADLADFADRYLAYFPDRYLADFPDRYLAYLSDRYRADRYRADLACRADLAYRADLADLADLAEMLLETLAATRRSVSLTTEKGVTP